MPLLSAADHAVRMAPAAVCRGADSLRPCVCSQKGRSKSAPLPSTASLGLSLLLRPSVLHAMDDRAQRSPSFDEADWWWIFDPRISLRARAALILGGSAIAFTLIFSWLAGTLLRRTLERQLGANFETLAFQVSDKLDRVIHQRFHELQFAAALAPFRTADASPADRRQLLHALQDSARDFAWIGFADAKGNISVATRGVFETTSVAARPWFRIGRERPHVGHLVESPGLSRELGLSDDERGSRFLDLAVPVQSTQGQPLGVLGAQVHWDWAREVQLSVVPETARRERIGVTIYSNAGDVLLDSGGSGWTQPFEPPAIGDARKFRGSMSEVPAGGGPAQLTGFARSRGYRDFRGLGWLTVVRQPADLALAPARALERLIAGWGFILSAVLTVVSWFVAGHVARRLRAIGLAAHRIQGGDILTVMPRARGDGEYARMCRALDAMVEDFRARQAPSGTHAHPDRTPPRGPV